MATDNSLSYDLYRALSTSEVIKDTDTYSIYLLEGTHRFYDEERLEIINYAVVNRTHNTIEYLAGSLPNALAVTENLEKGLSELLGDESLDEVLPPSEGGVAH